MRTRNPAQLSTLLVPRHVARRRAPPPAPAQTAPTAGSSVERPRPRHRGATSASRRAQLARRATARRGRRRRPERTETRRRASRAATPPTAPPATSSSAARSRICVATASPRSPRALHDRAERRDGHPRHLAVVDDATRQPRLVVHAEMREHVVGQRRVAGRGRRPRASTAASASPPDPVAAALVADHVAPAAGARRLAASRCGRTTIDPVPAMMTMPGVSRAPATSAISASLTTSDARPRADAPHDRANDARVVVAIDAGDAEADRRRRDRRDRRARPPSRRCSTFSTSSSPAACRFAPGPRASARIAPRSSASRQTVFVRRHRCRGRA